MPGTVLIVALVTVLAGCGQMPAPAPTPEPTTNVPPPSETGTPAVGTPAAGQLTLGDLAARVNAAWSGVGSYRLTFTGPIVAEPPQPGTPLARPAGTPGATPMARPQATFVSMREVALPDRQRQEVSGLGGEDHEAVASGSALFVRGPLAEQIAPGTPSDAWVAIDTSGLPEGATLSHLLGGLPQPPAAPLASIPERLWSQPVRELGTVDFDGRICQVYGAADTVTETGMRVDYAIAVDENDLPCFIETSLGGIIQGRDEYQDIDGPLTIATPTGATPVSIPAALASPAAHD